MQICRVCKTAPKCCCCSYDKVIQPCNCEYLVHESCLKNEISETKKRMPELIERSIRDYEQLRCPVCKYAIIFKEDFSKSCAKCGSDCCFPCLTILFIIILLLWITILGVLAQMFYWGGEYCESWIDDSWDYYSEYYYCYTYQHPFWLAYLILLPLVLIVYLGAKVWHHGREVFIDPHRSRLEDPADNIFMENESLMNESKEAMI